MRLKIRPLSLLTRTPSAPRKSMTTMGRLCVIHQLRDPNAHFNAIFSESYVRSWLMDNERKLMQTVQQRGEPFERK
ncbi:hypothetical protein J7T55_005283 [Diaporthe amygdali]|uniref:uncharacterized protein n=1 Tax=Phomopsis amygdali TaxID=1214568 RepID=UPI0022FEF76D|nr:uncharacterized protein J7T55_005283 [Diaporthe amygdali]KAJ0108306.1 hypothetical protein J7T55_005283 [Diaporthe amygdali]